MTIGTTAPLIDYVENGVTLIHPIPFQFRGTEEIVCTRIVAGGALPQTLGVDFNVAGGNGGTGSVTKTTGGTNGNVFRIERATTRAQPTDLTEHGAFSAETMEVSLDRLAAVNQEQDGAFDDLAGRALRVPLGETVAEAPVAAGRKGKIFGWNVITGVLEFLSYQSLANIIAPLLNVSFQGVPGPGTDLATHVDSYAVGNGVADDTAAFNTAVLAAQAATGRLRLGAKTYLISQLVIPAGVHVETAGVKTILKQKAGQPIGTVLVKITGSNSGIEGFTGIGNIATDASEFQNIVQVTCDVTTGSLTNIRIGDIVAQDVRGDVVLVNQNAAAYAAGYRLTGVDIGFISGDNIYRNGVSIVGGSQIRVAGVNCTRVGLYSLDIEPDAGCGPGAGYDIGPIKGHWVAAVSPTAADFIDAVTFHSLDLNPAYATNSVPAYPAPTRYGALTTRNAKSVTVLGALRAEGHPGAAYKPVFNAGELADQAVHIASLDMKNMCTDVAETAWCYGQGDAVKITIDHVNVDMGASVNEAVLRGMNFARIGSVEAKGTGGYRLIYGCADCEVGPVKVPANAGNILILSSDRIQVKGGSFSGDNVFGFSNDCQAYALTATATGGVDLGGNRNWLFGGSVGGTNIGFRLYTAAALLLSADLAGVLSAPSAVLTGVLNAASAQLTGLINAASVQVAGNKVLGARGAAVANAVNAAAAPTQAEFNAFVAQFNALASRFRVTGGHGAIAD